MRRGRKTGSTASSTLRINAKPSVSTRRRCARHGSEMRTSLVGTPFCHSCRIEDEIETRHALKQHDPRVMALAGYSNGADGLQTLD